MTSQDVVRGDCVELLRRLPDACIDAIVTDPPYDLVANKKGGCGVASINLDSPYGRSRIGTGNGSGGFMGKAWDSTGIAFTVELWREALRVLKPGGHLLAFGGTRTYHRMTCAIEDAGFEIRDCIQWIYGSGFPKSLNVSKAIDAANGDTDKRETVRPLEAPCGSNGKTFALNGGWQETPMITSAAWEGWGTALKPANEPIVVARKPLEGTVAANVQKYGTGALNIDGCRVATEDRLQGSSVRCDIRGGNFGNGHKKSSDVAFYEQNAEGRWPANVILDEAAAAELGDPARFFYVAKASTSEREAGLEHLPKKSAGELTGRQDDTDGLKSPRAGAGRGGGRANAHPTVKPISLMRHLIRLVLPPGGIVLDPFGGSGTTGCAAALEGANAILFEREEEYVKIAESRIEHWRRKAAESNANRLPGI